MHARNEEFLHASRVIRPRIWTGLLLNESYKVGSLVEQGAATEIYDGTEVSTGEAVALKILLPQLAEDARTRALFLDEARALRRLSQPGLLRYRACARDPESDLTYIVTDVVGMRLSSRLANKKLGEEDIVSLTRRLALALGAAHGAGVIHRNLRPHAIALPQGRLSEATITDFNLIKAAHSGLNPAFDDAMVDHDYCAPEQLSSSGEGAVVGPWTDVYSLALVILSVLGGKQSDAERKANPDLSLLPKKLRPVFERMLEPKPARRLQSMDEVVKQIDLGLGSAPLRSLFDRTQSVNFPRFGRAAARETPPPPARPVATPAARQAQPTPPAPAKPATPVAPPSAKQVQSAPPPPAPAKAAPIIAAPVSSQPAKPAPLVAATPLKASVATPVRPPLPPLPESLQPAKPVPLGKFHGPRTSIGLGGVARRGAVALSALLLAATPWIIQTSLPQGPADASTVPPAAKVQTVSKAEQAARAAAALPKGRAYGADNANSRITLRFHRPTRVAVHARQRLLFSRAVQPGDTYRAPSLAELAVTTEDAGAVEVLFNGASAGFVGENGTPVEKASLTRLASLAPRPAAPSNLKNNATPPAEAPATTVDVPEIAIELVPPDGAAQAETAQATDQSNAPTVAQSNAPVAQTDAAPVVEQAVASEQPPAALSQPAPATQQAVENLPEPPTIVQVTPSRLGAVASITVPAPQPAVEPEAPRTLLQRLFTRGTAPAQQDSAATALILAPAITKDAADRAKAASDMAKAAREAAQRKALEQTRRRESSFFNTNLGVTSPY